MDNSMVERLWRSLKYEDACIKDYESIEELIAGLRRYFHFYNNERPHQSFAGKTPAEVYWGSCTLRKVASSWALRVHCLEMAIDLNASKKWS